MRRFRLDGPLMPGRGRVFAVHAACIRGVEAFPVTVEISASGSIPGLTIVGMADAAVLEARMRIRCALRACDFEIPRCALTVSLAPGDVRKTGSGLDLPIAVAILALSNQISVDGLDDHLFVGELGLDGSVGSVNGEVAYQLLARDQGLSFVSGLGGPRVLFHGVSCKTLAFLSDLRLGVGRALRNHEATGPVRAPAPSPIDYSDVVGQEIAKRGIAVAAAGELGMLMVGSPGSGKTMLARRMTGILPPIEEGERQEALCVHSVVGEPIDFLLRGERPFRSPHHSISMAGLVGGGRPVRPGEISLAHGGVLYLDELGEFPPNALQLLRQPLEDGSIRVVRVDGAYTFPARFQLIAASNPCPCGYLGDREIPCRCSEASIERYRSKLTGPLADRIDLILEVARPDPDLIVRGAEGRSSADLRADVMRGREFRRWRERGMDADEPTELQGDAKSTVASQDLTDEGRSSLLEISKRKHLTGRGIVRLTRIARTIADMAESDAIDSAHLLEASLLQGRRGDGDA